MHDVRRLLAKTQGQFAFMDLLLPPVGRE